MRRLRVKRSTFVFICSVLADELQNSRKGCGIPLEKRVALSLNRLGTGNYLLSCADFFGVSEGLASIIVRDFSKAVLKVIRPLVVPKYSQSTLPRLGAEFERKHGIPYIMDQLMALIFPSLLLQATQLLSTTEKDFIRSSFKALLICRLFSRDWDFGWAGSLHDYTLFVNSTEGRKVISGAYKPYKLIGDAAYPFRTHMYVLFKGTKENLEPYKAYWNFIQSSTRMCVERAFGILKGRWRILLRRNEMQLENIADVVGACICLHNLCIMHKDFVEDNLVKKALKELHKFQIGNFSDLRTTGTMRILDYSKSEVGRANVDVEELIWQTTMPNQDDYPLHEEVNAESVSALKAGVTMHTELAKILFDRNLRETVPLNPDCLVAKDESSDEEEE